MPKLTGIEVVEALAERHSNIPIIMITAERDVTRLGAYPSVVQVIKKPFDLGLFVSAVSSALAKS